MTQQADQPDSAHLNQACEDIRAEYVRRKQLNKRDVGLVHLEFRLDQYGNLLQRFNLRPLGDRKILDAGCGNGRWLNWCCQRWGAREENCSGVDLRDELIIKWQREFPESRITLSVQPSHNLPYADAAFDIVHHSMMFSSITDPDLQRKTANELCRVLKPGGFFVWYDFWINPVNRNIVPMRMPLIRELFPNAELIFKRRVTIAPPLARLMPRFLDPLVPALESLRVLNTHYLLMFRKPDRSNS